MDNNVDTNNIDIDTIDINIDINSNDTNNIDKYIKSIDLSNFEKIFFFKFSKIGPQKASEAQIWCPFFPNDIPKKSGWV